MELLNATLCEIVPADAAAKAAARLRLEQLTMPHWALGRLMDLAEDLAGMTRSIHPPVNPGGSFVCVGWSIGIRTPLTSVQRKPPLLAT